jgi:hypothetical protein
MMADDQSRMQPPPAAGAAPEAPKGGFVASIVDIFADPFKVFARIDAGLTWWKPFVLVSAIAVAIGYLMLPLQQKLAQLSMRGLSEEQLQRAQEMGKYAAVGLITIPIIYLVIGLVMGGIVHIIINIMSSRSSFKKTLSLIWFCGIIGLVEQIITTVVLRMRGPDAIESAADMKFSLSLAPLLGSDKGLLSAVLQSLSIFQIWYYVVLVLGIAAIFKMSRKAAIVPVIPIWIIGVVMIWIGGMFTARMG